MNDLPDSQPGHLGWSSGHLPPTLPHRRTADRTPARTLFPSTSSPFSLTAGSLADAGLDAGARGSHGRTGSEQPSAEGPQPRGAPSPERGDRQAAAPMSRAQRLPEVSELERTCARSPCLGESQGCQGPLCQGRCHEFYAFCSFKAMDSCQMRLLIRD